MTTQTLGAMIASLRKEHGMTQLELAEKMGVTDKAVSKWERDVSCPDINLLPKLAEAFGVSVDQLMRVKSKSQTGGIRKEEVDRIIPLVFRAIALAMGVAVLVLSILRSLDMYTGFSLLGIGLVCVGISLFSEKDTTSE
ncbi:helix-turn-helix domain-containing protein [Raoultibacter phocaeensis]|uniref:helix-turn-helix domain-containing protein n=1 Tax=Raoultibacter phocaeensis TaxID=2479841 RepID=UPI00111B806F|nr:helix-turn-helix transcriptional regulator [Raoultibacter phocaeensis]